MAQQDALIKAAQERGINLAQADDRTWHGSFIHDGQEWTLDADTIEALSDDMHALADILQQDDTYSVDYNADLDRYVVDVEGFDEPFSDQTLAKAFATAKGALMAKLAKQEEERKAREAPKPAPKPLGKAAKAGNGPQSVMTEVPFVDKVPMPETTGDAPREERDKPIQQILDEAVAADPKEPPREIGEEPKPGREIERAVVRMLDAITERIKAGKEGVVLGGEKVPPGKGGGLGGTRPPGGFTPPKTTDASTGEVIEAVPPPAPPAPRKRGLTKRS